MVMMGWFRDGFDVEGWGWGSVWRSGFQVNMRLIYMGFRESDRLLRLQPDSAGSPKNWYLGKIYAHLYIYVIRVLNVAVDFI